MKRGLRFAQTTAPTRVKRTVQASITRRPALAAPLHVAPVGGEVLEDVVHRLKLIFRVDGVGQLLEGERADAIMF